MARQTKEELIAELYDELTLWRQARRALAESGVQSYTIHNRSLTRLDLSEINKMIKALQNDIEQLESNRKGSMRIMPVVFRDF